MGKNDNDYSFTRRSAMKLAGSGAALALTALNGCASRSYINSVANGKPPIQYSSWEDIYRDKWKWDKVSWGSHNNQCLPAGCSFRVYSKNGMV